MRHASRLAHGSIKYSRGVSLKEREGKGKGTMRDEMMGKVVLPLYNGEAGI